MNITENMNIKMVLHVNWILEICRYSKQCWFCFEICLLQHILHHLTQKFSLFTSSYLFLALKYFTIPMFLSIYFEEANLECLFKKLWRVRVQSDHTALNARRIFFAKYLFIKRTKSNFFLNTNSIFSFFLFLVLRFFKAQNMVSWYLYINCAKDIFFCSK